jgi:hypothetical protein
MSISRSQRRPAMRLTFVVTDRLAAYAAYVRAIRLAVTLSVVVVLDLLSRWGRSGVRRRRAERVGDDLVVREP